jgi:hypothetical protein
MKITLLGEFTDLNTYINAERRNRFLGAKLKKQNGDLALQQLTLKNIVTEYPVIIHFHWITPTSRKDPDNTSFAKKFLLDALVTKGILRGDTRKDIVSFEDTYSVDKENPRVEIEFIKYT